MIRENEQNKSATSRAEAEEDDDDEGDEDDEDEDDKEGEKKKRMVAEDRSMKRSNRTMIHTKLPNKKGLSFCSSLFFSLSSSSSI